MINLLKMDKINKMVSRMAGFKNNVNRDSLNDYKINRRISIIKKHISYVDNKRFIIENLKTPVKYDCDVLVVGGGPSGLSAAIGSSRAGAKTLLVERFGCFGGVITTVGMETIGWYRYEGTTDSEGIGIEMEKMAEQMGATRKWAYNDSNCLDAENFKVIADDLIKSNNIIPLLHTYVVDSIVVDNVIKGVIIENKGGRGAILAKRVIDCTGDADVAHLSGAEYTVLKKEKKMGVTQVFNTSGVDKNKFLNHVKNNIKTYSDWGAGWNQQTTEKEKNLPSPYLQKEFEKDKNLKTDNRIKFGGSWSSLTDRGEATNLNLVSLKKVDALDPNELTEAEMLTRKNVMQAIKAMKKNLPGFEKAELRNFGMTLGIRDTRKIVGRYNLTKNDVMEQGRFNDSIGIFPEFIDGYSTLILPTSGRYYQIPYGCLVPTVNNLLVAGRCVAGDMIAHASTRNMMCCTVTGQGAGIAAAVSIKNNKNTHGLDIKEVQKELLRQNVRIK
jgi:ribulose 1,5-bisphosphate synthetase/thiazole synthase